MTMDLFEPLMMGDLSLPNRIVMAPLTRNRALHEGDLPHELMALYYAQRASAGLIISEGVQISPEGKGYAWTPGIHSPEQVNGWRLVTQAVHDHGGRIFAQIWHVGRVSHSSLQPHNQAPVAPSAIAAKAHVFNGEGFVPTSTPRTLNIEDIARVIEDYRLAAVNAKAAGFDGIELHAANGYLIDQFLRDDSNKRTDAYGGSLENRTRLLVEILDVLATVWPTNRIGVRFSPFSSASGAADSNPQATFEYAITKVDDFGLAYLHLVEGETGGTRDLPPGADLKKLRACFSGVYMANNGYNLELAQQAIASGAADLIAFGRPFISNPDLVERLRQNAPLTPPDQKTFYGGGAEGYTDYPCFNEA